MSHLKKYVQYIHNTGRVPLPVEMFDEDHEPIGPQVRADLIKYGLAAQTALPGGKAGLTITLAGLTEIGHAPQSGGGGIQARTSDGHVGALRPDHPGPLARYLIVDPATGAPAMGETPVGADNVYVATYGVAADKDDLRHPWTLKVDEHVMRRYTLGGQSKLYRVLRVQDAEALP